MTVKSFRWVRTCSHLYFGVLAWSVVIFAQLAISPTTQAAPKAGRFFTPVEEIEPRTALSFTGSFSLGFSIDSTIALSQPFKKTFNTSSMDFRFQVPTSTRIDLAFGISDKLELGFGIGYLAYQSRYQTSADQIETVTFKSRPLGELLARYYLNFEQGIAGIVEGGLGYGKGEVIISSTQLSIAEEKETLNSFLAHAGLGLALGWAEGYSAHFLAGYSLITLGSKTYSEAEVTQSSALGGIYIKGGLRYQF